MDHHYSDAVLMLGGNLENTRRIFLKAIDLLSEKGCKVVRVSSLYESEPWGYSSQPLFLNQAILIGTDMNPQELLATVHEIENTLGRTREIHNGPRTIDIDILFFDDLIINEPQLQIPHPRMHERRFNLEPTQEITPDRVHPVFKKTVSELLIECHDPLTIRRLTN